MHPIIRRILATTLAVMALPYISSGIEVAGPWSALVTALVLSFLNVFLRPLLILFTLPFTLLSFGLFLFIVNGLVLYATSGLVSGFYVEGFLQAVWGSIVLTIVSWGLDRLVQQPDDDPWAEIRLRRQRAHRTDPGAEDDSEVIDLKPKDSSGKSWE